MKVEELQKALTDLARLLDGAGAKKIAGEVAAFAPALDRFRAQTLSTFANLLGRIDEEGKAAPKGRAKGAATPKPPKANPAELAAETKRLYDGAAGIQDSSAVVDLCARLAGLTVPQLREVAAGIEYRPTGKTATKPAMIEAIRHRIADRTGATIRRQLLDRPSTAGVPNGTAGSQAVDHEPSVSSG